MKKYISSTFISILVLLTLSLFFIACRKTPGNSIQPNKLPIANAGQDLFIALPTDSAMLDGTGSSDPEGSMGSFIWKKISGPSSFTIVHATQVKTVVKNLSAGTYRFELKVTDKSGLSSSDTIQVIVNNLTQPNQPPVANAGVDQEIHIPPFNVLFDGIASTDPDNNIVSYLWTKISGPSSYSITNPNVAQTLVTNLAEGVYQFELKVTDAGGLVDKDTIQVMAMYQPTACMDCKIVFVSSRDGNNEIYSCSVDGSNIHRLTYHQGSDDQPSWSPDGSRITFISDRTGNPEVYIMNADGTNVIRKTFSGTYNQDPTWSPDGTKIVYSTLSNGSMNIWVVGVTGGSSLLLFEAPGWDAHPAWSPDGTKIALVSDWAAYDFVFDIYTINADGSGFTALTGNIFDFLDYLHPSWSPNGTKLAMAMSQETGINIYNTQIGVMSPNGGGPIAIKSGAAPWTRTSWSADGTKIVYTSMSGSGQDVSWVSSDGSAWGTIVTNGWNADWQR